MNGMDMDELDPQIREALRSVRLTDTRRAELAALAEDTPAKTPSDRVRWQPWALGLAIAATLGLVALPLVPDPMLEAAGSGLLAGPKLEMSDVDRVRTGPFEVLAMGDTVRSLGVFDVERGEDVLTDPAVRDLPEGTTLLLLGVRGERRTLFVEQKGWQAPATNQRTYVVDPDTNRQIHVAVTAHTDSLVVIEANRPVALWMAEHARRGTPLTVETAWVYDQRVVSFDVGPQDAWIAPENDVALVIDGEIATIGLLTAMTGKTASMWMPQDVAETLVQRHTSGGSIRLARIDPFDPTQATITVAPGERKTVLVDALPRMLAE